jgi:hypothetical protein
MSYEDSLLGDIIRELSFRYPTPESRKKLSLNENLLREIFSIVENQNYDISPSSAIFPTENFSSTALSQFETSIINWVHPTVEYLAAEQIIRDLIVKGWNIIPPKGV